MLAAQAPFSMAETESPPAGELKALPSRGRRVVRARAGTHPSFPEIAAEMFLFRNAVKSHVNSIYRKLGTSSRSEAVSRLRDLGLLEA
jgi:DNA-binding NarL/FixJ family response regulator